MLLTILGLGMGTYTIRCWFQSSWISAKKTQTVIWQSLYRKRWIQQSSKTTFSITCPENNVTTRSRATLPKRETNLFFRKHTARYWGKLGTGLAILFSLNYAIFSRALRNDAQEERLNLSSRKFTAQDMVETAKKAAQAVEYKASCISHLVSIASRSGSFADQVEQRQAVKEAVELADCSVHRLQLCLQKEEELSKQSWRKWLVDSITISCGYRFTKEFFSLRPFFGYIYQLPLLGGKSLLIILSSFFSSLLSSFFAPWELYDALMRYSRKGTSSTKTASSSFEHVTSDLSMSDIEGIQDDRLRSILLQVQDASIKEQDAMEKYEALQQIFGTEKFSREQLQQLEEYQYRIAQAQEEIANLETNWNRWMLTIRRYEIEEAICLSTASRAEHSRVFWRDEIQHMEKDKHYYRLGINLWSLLVGTCFGKLTEMYLLGNDSWMTENPSWNGDNTLLLIGWVLGRLVKDIFEIYSSFQDSVRKQVRREEDYRWIEEWKQFRQQQI